MSVLCLDALPQCWSSLQWCSSAVQSADKELSIIPERWHVLLKEPGCEELGKKIVNWITERA